MLSQYTKLFYIISLAITFAITLWALNSPFIIYERTNMPDMHIKLLNDHDNSASYGKVLFALYILHRPKRKMRIISYSFFDDIIAPLQA